VSAERCIPCEDGRLLLLAALAARAAWILLRLPRPPDDAALLASLLSRGVLAVRTARAVMLLVSSLTPALAYRAAFNLRPSRAAALFAGMVVVLDPALIAAAARLTRATPFAALGFAFSFAALYARRSRRALDAALAASLAMAVLLIRGQTPLSLVLAPALVALFGVGLAAVAALD
jgi:dolichyl-phosphate-mannose--protein O-mannosyl transferase